MKRREFFGSSLGLAAMTHLPGGQNAQECSSGPFPNASGLTKYVAEFIVNTKYEDIPPDVLALGRKSILDGFGLCLSGSTSDMGPIVRKYLGAFAAANGKASMVGTGLKLPVRFAALANGIFIHA